jgi:galactokinase
VIRSDSLKQLFTPQIAEKKAVMLHRCQVALHHLYLHAYHIPGRIEVLGKHTDYAGGRSMVAATEQGLIMTVVPRQDRRVQITSLDLNATIEFEMHADLLPSAGTWANYPMTVARRVARNFPGDLKGAEIAISSDLPPASGLSSSSAMIIAIFLALADANDLWKREEFGRNIKSIEDLGGYLGCNENGQTFGDLAGDRGVGTFGGSQDHTAILGSERDRLKVYKYCPVKLEQTIAQPGNWTFAIGSSGVVAEKTGAAMEKYNQASLRVSRILELWRKQTGRKDATLYDALHSSIDAPDRIAGMLETDELKDRFDQFAAESNQIVPRAARAIAESNGQELGKLVDLSQKLAETKLGNQTRETSFLAKSARELGAIAASAFGAGFGGSVWTLIDLHEHPDFLTRWSQEYELSAPDTSANPTFFTTRPGAAACRIV